MLVSSCLKLVGLSGADDTDRVRWGKASDGIGGFRSRVPSCALRAPILAVTWASKADVACKVCEWASVGDEYGYRPRCETGSGWVTTESTGRGGSTGITLLRRAGIDMDGGSETMAGGTVVVSVVCWCAPCTRLALGEMLEVSVSPCTIKEAATSGEATENCCSSTRGMG